MGHEGTNSPKFYLGMKSICTRGKKDSGDKAMKVNDAVVDKLSEYFKVQDKEEFYKYLKANNIYNSKEPA